MQAKHIKADGKDNPMKTHKRIEWAYPTSTNAVRFGFGKSGCYTVEIQHGQNPPQAIAGFATIGEAEAHAGGLPHEWSAFTKRQATENI